MKRKSRYKQPTDDEITYIRDLYSSGERILSITCKTNQKFNKGYSRGRISRILKDCGEVVKKGNRKGSVRLELDKSTLQKIYDLAILGGSDYFIHKQLLYFHNIKVTRTKIHNVIANKDKERIGNGLQKLRDLNLINYQPLKVPEL